MNGETIRALRFYKGLTQLELAKKIGYSTATISLVENGVIPPSAALRMKLVCEFNIDEAFMRTLDDYRRLGELSV